MFSTHSHSTSAFTPSRSVPSRSRSN
jgi:hypothetical protein